MSAQHTPGPWQVAGARHSGDLKLGRDARLHMVGPDGEAVAAVFFDMKTGLGWKDARLIAAAPELLEALEKTPLRGRTEDPHTFDARQTAWLRDFFDPAITKARGQ